METLNNMEWRTEFDSNFWYGIIKGNKQRFIKVPQNELVKWAQIHGYEQKILNQNHFQFNEIDLLKGGDVVEMFRIARKKKMITLHEKLFGHVFLEPCWK